MYYRFWVRHKHIRDIDLAAAEQFFLTDEALLDEVEGVGGDGFKLKVEFGYSFGLDCF